ncbi:hypothetical protein LTR05_004806 [Lithohypha guttulata]|uniref:proline--tRNA ligase n=1 Tax=Lithohypha guttulata TaxID=1690604 RepID=A0AAN7SZG4_9EURO|nr:hypothetical protein LTR05_004806 [Lithohypha guttulata]
MRFSLGKPTSSKVLLSLKQDVYSFSATRRYASTSLQIASRQLRSAFWIPQASLTDNIDGSVDAGQLLIRAGYIRQAYSGIFHMLPLGLRVQSKIEALVDKHMQSLQASKVSLSSITSQKLWERTGRLHTGSEFFKFRDRKDGQWLLAPTHEEEITSLVRDVIHAPSHLPIRLYQITRKYRDEKRPRGGLLRGREFIMKDLYTFDKTETEAHATYVQVRQAYSNLFDELKLPYVEARADSGNMGGNLSHEFHFPSNLGEDDIITCSECDYAKNEEFVPTFTTTTEAINVSSSPACSSSIGDLQQMHSECFISKGRTSLVKAYAQSEESTQAQSLNPFAIKEAMGSYTEIDTGVEDATTLFKSRLGEKNGLVVYYLFDQVVSQEAARATVQADSEWLQKHNLKATMVKIDDSTTLQSHLLKRHTGDPCPACASAGRSGALVVTKAIEVGHTFHLGERYSSKLDLIVPASGQHGSNSTAEYVTMGCHGIGVSRLIAAVASALSDKTGLIWPRAIAPFEVLVVVNKENKTSADTLPIGHQIYDDLSTHQEMPADVLIDDRTDVNFGWKLKDADLIGYPVVVIIGKGWLKKKLVEIQCRRLQVKEEVPLAEAADRVRQLLQQL